MSISARGWVEIGGHFGRVFAFVRPAYRSRFPAQWLSAGRFRLSESDVADPFVRHRLMDMGETMIGFTQTDLLRMDNCMLLARLQEAHEFGRLLIVEAPRDEWVRHTKSLMTETRMVVSAVATAKAVPAPSTAASGPPAATPIAQVPLVVVSEKTWIEIRVIGDDDHALPDERYALTLGNGDVLTGQSDDGGIVRKTDLDHGVCRFTLPFLDHAAWSTISGGGAEAVTIAGGPAREHLVAEGQSTSSIACGYGFVPDTVWNDPDNSGLKQKRTHPNLLLPGDELAIPARKRKEITLATTQIHTFKRLGTRTLVVMQVLDGDAPRANQPWELAIGDQTSKGTSDGDGVVELWVAPSERSGTLTIGKDKFKLLLDFDHLHPLNEPSGVRQRLSNLGFWVELPDQTPDECLTAAVRSFQVRVELDPTGKIDDQTRQKLTDVHDRRCSFPAEPAITHKA